MDKRGVQEEVIICLSFFIGELKKYEMFETKYDTDYTNKKHAATLIVYALEAVVEALEE